MTATLKFTEADFVAIERERCKRDVFYFINEYVKIEDRDIEGIAIPFLLWESQKKVLTALIKERLVQVLKANQLGLTWLVIAYTIHNLIFHPGFSAKGISETEIKAKEIIRRCDFILRRLPRWFINDKKNNSCTWWESTALTVNIHHPRRDGKEQEDSTIQTFASSPTAAASFTANLFLFDEWALQEYAREIWTYAFPTINRATGGQVIGISTIERGSLFEEVWKAENNFVKIFLPWFSDPRRDEKWYNNTIKELGRDETLKHYPATVEEAFAIPGGTFFTEFSSLIHIKEPLAEIPSWYNKYRFLDYGLDMLACCFAYVDNKGFVRIYHEIHESNLVISEAAFRILHASGASIPCTIDAWNNLNVKEKQKIAETATEKFLITFAPPDLFAHSSHTGKSGADVWYENGIILTKSTNDFEAGCLAITNWLHPIRLRDEQTGEEYITAKLTIDKTMEDKSCAPNLVNSLLNIQKDKYNEKIYAKQPHNLTHSIDALRYFLTQIIQPATRKEEENLNLIPRPTAILRKRNLYDRSLKF